MSIKFDKTEKAVVIHLNGRLDSTNAAAVEKEIFENIESANVVMDASSLDYISSAGLRVVLVVAKKLQREGGRFVLSGLQPHIRDVFDISGFLSILETADDREAALAAI
ncbi:STAS domain-containing protein [Aquamicrobium zhengzhouense]|uniref:Anti-sigma factor antagonist n=1 Tax=Aquamicrobium zhengzhouense TaxID=2781738 RepID=A0ABS0SEP8_9HYPH|nr:STAS domain-containing protein [Aquamicrobium zhengzhouense]MBI1621778.1 STAS domain-containing protein [Aquamicrobium zhengzhouense]